MTPEQAERIACALERIAAVMDGRGNSLPGVEGVCHGERDAYVEISIGEAAGAVYTLAAGLSDPMWWEGDGWSDTPLAKMLVNAGYAASGQ